MSKCSVQQANVTEGTGNRTETEKQGSVPLTYGLKQF